MQNKNQLFWYLFIGALIICSILFYETSLIAKIITTESIGGLSSGKTIMFFISLTLFFWFANSKYKTKNNKFILVFIIIFLISLNLFSYFVFIDYNNLPNQQIEFVYSERTNTFSYNDLEHIHSFKPAMFPFSKEDLLPGFDIGTEFYDFMPEWFSYIYYLGFFTFIIFTILYLKYFLSFKKEKRIKKFFLAGSGYFLLTNAFFDGGLITPVFFAGLILTIIAFLPELKEKNKKLNNLEKLLRKILPYLLIPLIILIGFITNTFFFFISQTTTILCINKIIFDKKLIQKSYWVLILSGTILMALSFGLHSYHSLEFYYNDLKEDSLILACPEFVKDTKLVTLIEENSGLNFYKTNQNLTTKDIISSEKNERIRQYFFIWGKHCNFIKDTYRVIIYTNNKFNDKIDKNYGTLLENIQIIPQGPTKYLVKFTGSICIKDYKRIIIEYLRKQGLHNFISTQ